LPDFSNIDFSNIDIDAILKDYQDGQDIGEPEPITSFFEAPAPVMPEAPAEVPVSAGLFDFDTEKPTPTSFDFDAIGKPLPSFFDTGENPSIPSFIPKQVFDQVPVMPSAPVSSGSFGITPEMIAKQIEKQKIEGIEPIYDRVAEEQIIPSFVPQSVINQVPVMPEMPIYQEPINIPQIPNFPIQKPMNFTGLPQILPQMQAPYIPPQMQAPAYVQPRVEDIIAPIRSGSVRKFQQPGLFNLR
jgi:hypothetical protein